MNEFDAMDRESDINSEEASENAQDVENAAQEEKNDEENVDKELKNEEMTAEAAETAQEEPAAAPEEPVQAAAPEEPKPAWESAPVQPEPQPQGYSQAGSYTETPNQFRPQQQPYYHQPYPSQGYYRPQTNEYVYAPQPQPPKKKKNVGKGLLIALGCILAAFVISLASISAFRYFTYVPEDSLRSKVPIEEHQFTNKSDDETVIDDDDDDDNDKITTEKDDDDEDLPENVNEEISSDISEETEDDSHTKLRDFPSVEQLAAPDDAMKIPDIYDKVSPSVVGISAPVQGGTQLGTGFIISEDGYIVTNAHVIEGYNSTVKVVDRDLNEYDAEVIGSDEQTDIAVLRIDPSDFDITPVELGISSDLRIGELAIAIGNPLGFDLYGTMTTGIISGLNRNVTIEDNSMTLMQTSAAINSGNSGGPLIDAYGRVIGITSAKIDSMYGESLGFAIPIDEAMPIVRNLIEYGYVLGRPSLGITGMDITRMISLFYNLPEGIQVTYVDEGSGAYDAGIIAGDIIIGIEGETVESMSELNEVKKRFSVGDTVTLTIYRPERSEWGNSQGRSFDVEVVLTEASPAPQG